MKPYLWNHEKNDLLRTVRGLTFEDIVRAIEEGGLLDTLPHPNQKDHPNQSIFIVEYQNYIYVVPFVEESDYYFLKTIIPNRKATKHYLNRSTHHGST